MFWHRLALALGMSVAEAQRKIGRAEFRTWMAYDRLQPIGPDRQDWHAAMLATVMANAWGGGKRRPKLKDFLPEWGPREPMDPRQMEQLVRMQLKMRRKQLKKDK